MSAMKQSPVQQTPVAPLPTPDQQHAGNTALLPKGELSDNDLGLVAGGGKAGLYLGGLGGIGGFSFPRLF
jgi:hypothetical protein